MGNTRAISTLATAQLISPNHNTPRTKPVRRLTPHHVAGNLSVSSILGLPNFQAGGSASANYAIDSSGKIGLCVEESSRSWASSSSVNDYQAITCEIANNGGAPDWRMSDEAINSWLKLSVDVCKFYGFNKVNYKEKPADVATSTTASIRSNAAESWIATWAKDNEMIITLHNWFSATACPGPYFTRQIPWLVKEMNKRLMDPTWAESFVGEGGLLAITPPALSAFKEYLIAITAAALNVRKGPGTNYAVERVLINDKNLYTIVDEATGEGASGKWGKLKSGAGWIALNYTKKR